VRIPSPRKNFSLALWYRDLVFSLQRQNIKNFTLLVAAIGFAAILFSTNFGTTPNTATKKKLFNTH
jgi:hypothetical protein